MKPYSTIQEIALNTTGITYSDVMNFEKFSEAEQFEIKTNVKTWDGSVKFTIEVSDDNETWFEVDDSSWTIAAVEDGWIIIDAQWKYMRVKIDYTHSSAETNIDLFTLIR